jgi:hypothetical protein
MTNNSPMYTSTGGVYTANIPLGRSYSDIKYIKTAFNGYKSEVNYFFGFDV